MSEKDRTSVNRPVLDTAGILDQLRANADPGRLAGMPRFGLAVEKRLGVSVPGMRRIAGRSGKNHRLALELWRTCIVEARIVASMVAVPERLTEAQD